MMGIFDNLTIALLTSIAALLYTPTITMVLLAHTNLLNRSGRRTTWLLYIVAFIMLFTLTLILIRIYPIKALNGMIVYGILLTLALTLYYLIKGLRKLARRKSV